MEGSNQLKAIHIYLEFTIISLDNLGVILNIRVPSKEKDLPYALSNWMIACFVREASINKGLASNPRMDLNKVFVYLLNLAWAPQIKSKNGHSNEVSFVLRRFNDIKKRVFDCHSFCWVQIWWCVHDHILQWITYDHVFVLHKMIGDHVPSP